MVIAVPDQKGEVQGGTKPEPLAGSARDDGVSDGGAGHGGSREGERERETQTHTDSETYSSRERERDNTRAVNTKFEMGRGCAAEKKRGEG